MKSIKMLKKKQSSLLQVKARKLYKTGLSLRKVGDIMGMSHEWVRAAIYAGGDNYLDTLDTKV